MLPRYLKETSGEQCGEVVQRGGVQCVHFLTCEPDHLAVELHELEIQAPEVKGEIIAKYEGKRLPGPGTEVSGWLWQQTCCTLSKTERGSTQWEVRGRVEYQQESMPPMHEESLRELETWPCC